MKQLIFITAILAVVIFCLPACKTSKNLSKQSEVPPTNVENTNASTELLNAILAEEKKGNEKKVKNNWYPNLPGHPLPEKSTEESAKNVTYIFNIEFPILPEREQLVYAPVPPDNEYELGANLPPIDKSWLWLAAIIGAVILSIIIFGKNRTTSQSVDIASFTNLVAALKPGGGKFTYRQNGLTIKVKVNSITPPTLPVKEEVKKEVPDSKTSNAE